MSQPTLRNPRERPILFGMARPLRLEHAGAIWHLTARGNERKDIFLDDGDRNSFLVRLAGNVTTFRWRLHAWVLMSNHYHLLIETPEPNLALGMQRLNASYAQRFNRRHARVGHLFQGRYNSVLVERESHLLELTRYVVLNPVRAGMSRCARDYEWSSYRETAGLRSQAEWLEVNWTLSQFGHTRRDARRRYVEFVDAPIARHYRPWDQLRGRIYIGGETFKRQIDERLAHIDHDPEIPRDQRVLFPRPTLEELLDIVAQTFKTPVDAIQSHPRGEARKAFALLARRCAAARLHDIGAVLRINHWSASHSASAAEVLEAKSARFRSQLRDAEQEVAKLAK